MHRWPELFLALRFLRPRRTFVSIITVLSWLGVVAGVLVLIVVQSVMRGFEDELTRKVIGFQSHLTVTGNVPLRDPAMLIDLIRQEPGVVGATAAVVGPVLAETHSRISTPRIKGWDAATAPSVLPLEDCLVGGTWAPGPDQLVVGSEWARANHVEIGTEVNLLAPQQFKDVIQSKKQSGNSARKIPLPRAFRVAGIFTTGMFDYDSEYLITDLFTAQELYAVPNEVHGIAIKLQNPDQAAKIAEHLRARLGPDIRVLTWMDHNQRLFAAVAVERRVMSFLLFFVMAVAALGLSGTLITVTVQRAKSIGTLAALGATPRQIATIFTMYGVVVGVLGSVAGVIGAGLVLANRNALSQAIGRLTGQDLFPAEIYHFSGLPARYDAVVFLGVALAGMALSVLAALVPAWVASQTEPAANLRRA
ncbi:MAG: ABC transporter permease [Verrucomicrobia bacterium]|nr:ABC transporter permease [Verrucomicrobiota bacterium]